MKKIILPLLAAILLGCTSGSDNHLTGKWTFYKIIQNGTDVTEAHDPYNERFFILKADSTFESGGRPYGENTGKYLINADENKLFLDSDTGPEDDSQWRISVQKDTMKWQGFGTEWANGFQIILTKEE